jgi:2-C-methyl-D-erythritol 4-phosphate cytidylyltransferase
MNIAVIFAGGVGSRMGKKNIPKQFLIVNDKPILIHTLEKFQNNKNIDAIVLASIPKFIDYTLELAEEYGITKLKKVVGGGETGQQSIYHGLLAAKEIAKDEPSIVLVHDGVRPIIDDELIDNNIETVKKYGNSITCVECKETIVTLTAHNHISETIDRNKIRIARAPQCFMLDDILEAHEKAIAEGLNNIIDSCTLMRRYGHSLHLTMGKSENIKITTPDDYHVFKSLLDARIKEAEEEEE